MDKLLDLQGNSFQEGDKVARAAVNGSSGYIVLCKVTKIEAGKMYLDNSKQHIRYPNRLLIVETEPLTKLMKQYEKSKALKENGSD